LVSRCLAFPCKRGSQRAVVPWPFVVPWTSGACGRLPRRYLCTILTCVHLRAYVHLCRHHRHAELPSLVSHTHVAHSFPSAFPRAHLSSLGLSSLGASVSTTLHRLLCLHCIVAPSSVFVLSSFHRLLCQLCTVFCVCLRPVVFHARYLATPLAPTSQGCTSTAHGTVTVDSAFLAHCDVPSTLAGVVRVVRVVREQVGPFCHRDSPETCTCYALYGCVEHHGNLSSGHCKFTHIQDSTYSHTSYSHTCLFSDRERQRQRETEREIEREIERETEREKEAESTR
jgi:hypothetical protein